MQHLKQRLIMLFLFSKSSRVAFTVCIEVLLGLLFTTASLALFLKLAEDVVNQEVVTIDWAIIHFVYLFRTPAMTQLMLLFTFLGGQLFVSGAIITTIIFLFFNKHRKDALVFAFILFLGIGLNYFLKDLFHRPRPNFFPLVHEATYSFPSGHAMNSFIFYTSLSYFIVRKLQKKKLKYILMFFFSVLIGLIGISRIYLGAHYPSDVLAGYFAGFWWFVIVLLFEKTLYFFQLFRTFEFEKKY